MSYFIALCAVLAASFALSNITRGKFEVLFPIVNLSVPLTLYVFGLFGALRAGGVFLLALSALLTLFSVVLCVKRRHGSAPMPKIPYFGLAISAIAVCQYVALFGMQTFSWDELTHWALVVKNMFFRGDFGGGTGATTMFPGYPVGSSLYLYFFEMHGAEFEPAHLYMAMNLANLGFIMPIAARMKTLGKKLAAIGLTVAMLLAFNFTTLSTVWSDTFLATLFSYIMAVYFTAEDGKLSLSGSIGIVLASAVLTLAKSTGIAFVLMAYVIIGADMLARRGSVKIHPAVIAAAFVATALAKLSWSLYTDIQGLGEAWDTNALTLDAVLKYITAPTEHQLAVTGKFALQFFLPLEYHGNGYHTPIPLVLIAALVVFILHRIARRDGAPVRAVAVGIAVGATFLIYSVATLISYIFSFSTGEALVLASYARYMNTYVIGILIMLGAIISSGVRETEEKKTPALLLARTAVITALVCTVISPITGAVMNPLISPYKTYTDTVANLCEDDSIYNITAGNGEFLTTAHEEYLVLRYLATPIQSSGLKEGGSPYRGDPWDAKMSAEETLAAFEDGGYTVLYIHRLDQSSRQALAELFDSEIREYTFYTYDGSTFTELED